MKNNGKKSGPSVAKIVILVVLGIVAFNLLLFVGGFIFGTLSYQPTGKEKEILEKQSSSSTVIKIDQNGNTSIDGKEINREEIVPYLIEKLDAFKESSDYVVHIYSDSNSEHENMRNVFSLVKSIKDERINIKFGLTK